jgi:hypothetical protein
MANGIGWTADELDLIREMWTAGLTCPAIARVFSYRGATPNAIIGQVHKMGLPLRAAQRPWARGAKIRSGGGRVTVELPPPVPRPDPGPLPALIDPSRPPVVREPIRAPVPLPLAPIVVQPMRGTCQWVLGLRPGTLALMCDAPAVAFRRDGSVCPEGAVWCRDCRAKVYQRAAA